MSLSDHVIAFYEFMSNVQPSKKFFFKWYTSDIKMLTWIQLYSENNI